MKTIVSVFPIAKDFHLFKEIGMIPFFFQKEYDFKSYVACYEDEVELPSLNVLKGLGHLKINRVTGSETINLFIFIFRYVRKIDILVLYHLSLRKVLVLILAKCLTFGKCKVYLKMDADGRYFNKGFQGYSLYSRLKNVAYNLFDLLSVETSSLHHFFSTKTKLKVQLIPNGYFPDHSKLNYDEKSNRILTVSRPGDPVKNVEMLVKSFLKSNPSNWELSIVGQYTDSFRDFLSAELAKTPDARGKIYLLGPIYDRKELKLLYLQAKVFALTSISESFGIVLVEALSNGCFLLTSDVLAANDVTENQKFGKIFPIGDIDALSNLLSDLDLGRILLPQPATISEFAEENFHWKVIVRKIAANLNIYD